MLMIIKKEDMDKFKDILMKEYDLYAPVTVEDIINFQRITLGVKIDLNYSNTTKPPKHLFFPQSEKIFKYRLKKNEVELEQNSEINKERVILGIRPCDALSLSILDKVFSWDFQDSFYLEKRDKTTIITLSCKEIEESCFCTSFNAGSHFGREGSDLLLIEDLDNFLVEVVTEKGERLVNKNSTLFKEVDKGKDYSSYEERFKDKVKKKVNLEKVKDWLDNNFEHSLWEEIAQKCLGCAVCSYLCPTCHCFDLVDEEIDTTKGVRLRNWDSCNFEQFTAMPAHQTRPEQYRRFRQRIMHKFKYFIDRFGKIACVGCGRCLKHCPVKMDFTQFLEEIRSML